VLKIDDLMREEEDRDGDEDSLSSSGDLTVKRTVETTKAPRSSISELLVNGTQQRKKSTPVLIHRHSNAEQQQPQNHCIPDQVKNALEHAGFDFEQILEITKDAQISLLATASDHQRNHQSQSESTPDIIPQPATTADSASNLNEASSELKKTSQKNSPSEELMMSISNLRGLDVVQNISAQVTNQVQTPGAFFNSNNNSKVEIGSQTSNTRMMRRKSGASPRYATICHFTSSRDTAGSPEFDEKVGAGEDEMDGLKYSPNWASSDVIMQNSATQATSNNDDSSPSSSCISNEHSASFASSSQIIPPKVFVKFKPVVNVHRRACTSVAADEMKKLNSSLSTDSFLIPKTTAGVTTTATPSMGVTASAMANSSNNNSQELDTAGSTDDDLGDLRNTRRYDQLVDLTNSLPNRGCKRQQQQQQHQHVTRSLSYNVGKLAAAAALLDNGGGGGGSIANVSTPNNNRHLLHRLSVMANTAYTSEAKLNHEPGAAGMLSKTSMPSIHDFSQHGTTGNLSNNSLLYSSQSTAAGAASTLHSPSNIFDLFIKGDLFSPSKKTTSSMCGGESGKGEDTANKDSSNETTSMLIDSLLNIATGNSSSSQAVQPTVRSMSFKQPSNSASSSGLLNLSPPYGLLGAMATNLPTSLSATDLQTFAIGNDGLSVSGKDANGDELTMLKASQDFCHVSELELFFLFNFI
jgi:hypothetical protein